MMERREETEDMDITKFSLILKLNRQREFGTSLT